MKKEIDITKSCEWLGEFWCIENEKSKYHGILSYAPKGEIYNLHFMLHTTLKVIQPQGD